MEGVAGTYEYDHPNLMSPNQVSKRQRWGNFLTLEVNAAVEALLDLGIEDITVCDGHGPGDLIDLEKIHPKVKTVVGQKRIKWLPFFDGTYDALLLIGAHAMEGAKNGTLSHTYSRKTINKFSLNNVVVGEIGVIAALAGFYNVPFIFISGDKAAIDESKFYVPNIFSVSVKEGISTLCTKTIHVSESVNQINAEVKRSVDSYKSIKNYKISPPYKLVVSYKSSFIAFYKWLCKRINRPEYVLPNKLLFSHPDNLDYLFTWFKEL